MVINPYALATGFEERMSTFSQEMRALNHVRIVVMEILVYDMRPRICVLCFGWSHGKGIYGLISHYILLRHY